MPTPWPDHKLAPFVMVFDDSCDSHRDLVIPELVKRNLTGTFYPIPGAKWYDAPFWARIAHTPGITLANHTYTHAGATSVEQADDDIARAEQHLDHLEGIDQTRPKADRKKRSFCIPGGVPWTLTPEENAALFQKHHLIHRPASAGFRADTMTPEELLATPDQALATGELGYLVFHGVGGDWLTVARDPFLKLLDKLDSLRDRLWITDPISWHLASS